MTVKMVPLPKKSIMSVYGIIMLNLFSEIVTSSTSGPETVAAVNSSFSRSLFEYIFSLNIEFLNSSALHESKQ